jgi:hypothetical protein
MQLPCPAVIQDVCKALRMSIKEELVPFRIEVRRLQSRFRYPVQPGVREVLYRTNVTLLSRPAYVYYHAIFCFPTARCCGKGCGNVTSR